MEHCHIHDDDLYIDEKDPSYGRDTHSHITICGGLPCEAHLELAELANSLEPVRFTFGKLAVWPAKRYDVIHLTLHGGYAQLKELRKMVGKLRTKRYFAGEFHCTIAYVKKGVVQKLMISEHEDMLRSVKCVAEELEFVQRDASIISFSLGPSLRQTQPE